MMNKMLRVAGLAALLAVAACKSGVAPNEYCYFDEASEGQVCGEPQGLQ